MKVKSKIIYLLVLGMLFVACKQENDLENYMVNNWQTTFMKIEMPTAYGKDSLQVYEDNFSKEGSIVAQSSYKKDGTFKAWYLQNGIKTQETDGKWSVKGDSLYVEYTLAGKTVKPAYKAEKTEKGLFLVSKFDWDNDGQKDDLLTMKSKQIQLSENRDSRPPVGF